MCTLVRCCGSVYIGGVLWSVYTGGVLWNAYIGGVLWSVYTGGVLWNAYIGGVLWSVYIGRILIVQDRESIHIVHTGELLWSGVHVVDCVHRCTLVERCGMCKKM